MSAQHTPTRFRVRHFLSRLGEDRYTVECSVDGKPWHAQRGPNGRVRAFHSETKALAAIAKATGWEAVKLECYVAPRLSQWFVCRTLANGHIEHLRHDSGQIGVLGSIRHFNNETEARAAIAKATGSAA